MKFFFTPIIAFLAIVCFSSAQNNIVKSGSINLENNKEYKFIIKMALKYFSRGDYHNALDWYEEALHKDSNNVSVLFNTAICHIDLYADMKSVYYLKKANSLLPNFSSDYHYWLATAFHLNLAFDSATDHYNKYLLENKNHPEKIVSIQKLISEASIGKKYVEKNKNYYCENLKIPVNGEYSEKNAKWAKNYQSLYFNSDRTEGKGKREITHKGDAFENIYFSEIKNGKFSYPIILKGINKKKENTEIINLFDNNSKMLVSQSVKIKKLFISEKSGETWSNLIPFLSDVELLENFSSLYLSEDGSIIIFSSSHLGNNFDLYSMNNIGGKWTKPQALNNSINSSADENFPILSLDKQTLYFSSKRDLGMGGYDIYESKYNNERKDWETPINLAYPINSPADDFFSFYDQKNNKRLLISNRSGGNGEFDVFSVEPFAQVNVKGNIVIKGLEENKNNLILKFYSNSSDTINAENINGVYSTKLPSSYLYKAKIVDRDGKILKVEEFFIPSVKNDSTTLFKDFNIELKVLETEPSLQLTDRYLVKIDYEPTKPFIINGLLKDDKKLKNQKSKIILHDYLNNKTIAETEADSLGKYQFIIKPEGLKNYRIEIKSNNYLPEWINIIGVDSLPKNSNESELKKNQFNSLLLTSVLHKNENVLARVYFSLSNAEINNSDEIYLNSVVEKLIKNPKLKILIKGYDDNTGEKLINNRISHQRAENVKKYFLKKGVSQNRMIDKGMGSNFFAASNDEEINGRDNNRRVEIELMK